jgi:hypothetical protein
MSPGISNSLQAPAAIPHSDGMVDQFSKITREDACRMGVSEKKEGLGIPNLSPLRVEIRYQAYPSVNT